MENEEKIEEFRKWLNSDKWRTELLMSERKNSGQYLRYRKFIEKPIIQDEDGGISFSYKCYLMFDGIMSIEEVNDFSPNLNDFEFIFIEDSEITKQFMLYALNK